MKRINIYKITSIGRPMDFSYPSNVVISLLAVIIWAGVFIYQVASGFYWLEGLLWGLGISISVFLGWALSREIEPGKDLPSYFAAAFTLITVFYHYPPNFIVLIWLMFILRVLNRSTGLQARWTDSAGITLLSGWLVYIGFWQFTLMGAMVFLADAFLPKKNRKQVIFAILHVVLFALAFILNERSPGFYPPSVTILISVIVIGILLIITTLLQVKETADDDSQHKPLDLTRVKTTRILALLVAVLVTFWHGDAGFRWIMPLWATLAGSVLYRILLMIGFHKWFIRIG